MIKLFKSYRSRNELGSIRGEYKVMPVRGDPYACEAPKTWCNNCQLCFNGKIYEKIGADGLTLSERLHGVGANPKCKKPDFVGLTASHSTKKDWIVFFMSILFVIFSCDSITEYIGNWWSQFCCISALLCGFYFVIRLFCLWQKEMKL